MKRNVRLALSLLVTFVLAAIGLLSGCSGSSGGGASASTAPQSSQPGSSAEPAKKAEAPMEITVLGVNPPNDDNSYVQQYLEKKYNVKFKNMRVNRDTWQEQLNIKLAAKEIPDIWYLWSVGEVQKYQQQGLLAALPRDLINQTMPTYTKQIADLNAEDAWTRARFDGKYYGIPHLWTDGATSYLTGYNKKWLDKLGFSGPPKNLQEFEQWLIKVRNDDPDGDGKKDTYGYSTTGKYTFQAFNTIFAAYQVFPNLWVKNDQGDLQLGMTTERAREAFKQISKWYKEDLIDPEFITVDSEKFYKDVSDGRSGIEEDYWYYFDDTGTVQKMFKDKNPGNELVVGGPLAGPYGPGKALSYGPFTAYVGMGVQVEKQPEKMKKILQMWNDITSDPELYKIVSFGKEGESFQMKDGLVEMLGDNTKQDVLGGKYGAGDYYNPFRGSVVAFDKFSRPQSSLDFKEKVTKGVPTMYNLKYFAVPADTEFPDLGKLQDEYLIKFATGEVDLDKGFDDFVAKWKAAGGEKITQQVNDYYKKNFK